MPDDQRKNPNEKTSATSQQSVPSEEESCLVPSSLPCDNTSTMSSTTNNQPAFGNSSLESGVDVAAWSMNDREQSLEIPELVSGSEDDLADDVSFHTASGTCNGGGSGGAMCRICHEGDQDEPLVSLCRCSGTVRFVHVSCLELWLNNQNVDFCELCSQRFPMAAQPSSVLRFFHWLSQSDRQLRGELLFVLLVLITMILITVTLLLSVLEAASWAERQWYSSVECFCRAFVLGFFSCALLFVYVPMFDMLCDWYHVFVAWELAHPLRRIASPFRENSDS
ncbi:E3 ubiquitin-protein ligase MARCHF8-like [Rhipicephalus sanguineus]|uniref:E3 ubiquitin-protein ligase MARCHF8-like n=1 Tax=Rhipicephalus sanguineus TaxID=34632 RepID=UPI00189569FC|nr:E3 ubiquitin-protein ligase MARCHF8-like [Rhipicephalus sanguineus]